MLGGFEYEVVNLKPPKSRKRSHNAGVELAGCRDAHHHHYHTGSSNSVPIILKFQVEFKSFLLQNHCPLSTKC